MVRATVVTLLTEVPHGVFESHSPSRTDVFAEIRSVSMKEFYLAANDGIEPEVVFRLTDYADYAGQKILEHDGVVYDIIRTYTSDDMHIDLTCKRREKNQ